MARNLRVISTLGEVPARPCGDRNGPAAERAWRMARVGWRLTARRAETYWMSLLAAATASVRACFAGTLLNSACSTALRTTALTSAFFGIVGTMSW